MIYIAVLILTGGSVFLLFVNLFSEREDRFPLLAHLVPAGSRKKSGFSPLKLLRPLTLSLEPLCVKLPYLRKLQLKLEALKINMDVGLLILVKIFMMVVSGFLVFLFFSPGLALIASFAGFFIPDFLLLRKLKAKKQEIVRGFPETIDLLDLCIGAGLDFTSSVKWVIDKTDSNAFVEQLEIVLNEIHIGKSQVQALRDMAKRLSLPDISSFARSVVQAENMGTSLEEAFKNLSEDTRLARFQAGERFAIKASLKILFPLLFLILPVIMIVVAGPIIIKFTQGDFLGGALQ